MNNALRKLKLWWLAMCGYHDCPICKHRTVKWIKDWIYHPEEPPMLGHWQCVNPDCLVSSEMKGTPLSDGIARERGYPDFITAMEQNIPADKS